jgi:hypothetical protein
MVEADFTEFRELLDAVCSLLSRGAYVPNATNTALFFRALQEHPIGAVRAAFEAHVKDPQRGRFVPTPADLIAQLQGTAENDGRPGADEAWAGALGAADEDATIVWTDEMAQAWFAAKPVFELGDKVGARMAFRDAYERIVAEARKARQPVRWQTSLGHDKRQRAAAIREAVDMGRLPSSALQLPMARDGQMPLLELIAGSEVQSPAGEEARAKIRALLARMRQQQDEPGPSADALAKAETRRRQDEIAAQVRAAQG